MTAGPLSAELIIWEDIVGKGGSAWNSPKDAPVDTAIVYQLGFVIFENDFGITITDTYAPGDDDCDIGVATHIPKNVILEREPLCTFFADPLPITTKKE